MGVYRVCLAFLLLAGKQTGRKAQETNGELSRKTTLNSHDSIQ